MRLTIKRILFYLLSFTWGGILSMIGLIMMIPFIITKRFGTYHGRIYGIFPERFGQNWGFEMGCFFFVAENMKDNEYIKRHECGHGLQNVLMGPFQIIIQIWSMLRYWYRELMFYRKHKQPKTSYDSIWFEHWATDWGTRFVSTDII